MQAEQPGGTRQTCNSVGAVLPNPMSVSGCFECSKCMSAQAAAMLQGLFHAPGTHAGVAWAAACRHDAARGCVLLLPRECGYIPFLSAAPVQDARTGCVSFP